MVYRRQRLGHHIQVRGRVLLKAGHDHQRVAEHLVEPGPDFLGDRQRLAPLDVPDDFEQVYAPDFVDGPFTQEGQHIVCEDARDQGLGGLPSLFKGQTPVREPF